MIVPALPLAGVVLFGALVYLVGARRLGLFVALLVVSGCELSQVRQTTGAILERTNAARQAGGVCGVEEHAPQMPLRRSGVLDRAAERHARDMAGRQELTHSGSDGSSVAARVARQSYAFLVVGENIHRFAGAPDGDIAMQGGRVVINEGHAVNVVGWLDSPGHCGNIHDGRFTAIGIGYAEGEVNGQPGAYYVQVFAKPR